MPRYIDGFIIPIKRTKLAAYRRIAKASGKVWREHGALDYKECVGEDLDHAHCAAPFHALAKVKKGETVLFSYILYKSRAHRDRVNAKVMKDPRMNAMMSMDDMPFDMKRMSYGGFTVLVDG